MADYDNINWRAASSLPILQTADDNDTLIGLHGGALARILASALGTGGGSWSITAEKEDGVTTLTITDGESEQVVEIYDGTDGGAPSISAARTGSTVTLTITAADGTVSTVDLHDGTDGADGSDGQDGADGQDGQDGADGFSPTISVSKVGGVATVYITDKNGTQSFELRDAETSYTLPVASASTLGGVRPAARTADMTQTVGVDSAGALYTSVGKSYWTGTQAEYEALGSWDAGMLYVILPEPDPQEENP